MKQYDKGWIEAFIDSEGCITRHWGFKRKYVTPILIIGNSNIRMVERARSIAQGGTIRNANVKNGRVPFYHFRIQGHALKQLLSRLSLIEKEQQRRIAIEMMRLRPSTAWGRKGQKSTLNPNLERVAELGDQLIALNSGKGRFKAIALA
jgi:hypothetical protein